MWEPILIAAAGVYGLWYHVRRNRERLDVWEEAAKAHGLKIEEQSDFMIGFMKLEARDGAVTVQIEDARRKDVHTRMIASAPGPTGSYAVRIQRQPLFAPWAREVEIGDELFDPRFLIEGPVPLLAALLDEPTRGLLTRLSDECRKMEVVGPEITVYLFDDQVPDILNGALAIIRRFEQVADASRCLADNALHDSQTGVRLLNLRLLAREHPGEAVTNETLRQACSDPSPRVRLQAATSLGEEGRDVLLRLAEALEDDECSAQAVSALERALPFERARDLLLAALSQRRTQTAGACLESLAKGGESAAVDVLAKTLADESEDLAVAAALALGETGRGEAELPLVGALQSERSEVRVAAAQALGRVGSVTAVLPLKEAAESSLLERELRRTARQSVAEIQSRLPGASPGQLSMAGDEAGQLSLAEAEAGQLSLAADPAGQLSLPDSD